MASHGQIQPPTQDDTSRSYAEDPEAIQMNRWRMEAMLRRFLDARERSLGSIVAWFGVFLAMFSPLLSETFTMNLWFLSSVHWKVIFGVGALYALIQVLVGIVRRGAWWLAGLPDLTVSGWVLHKKPIDWVPANCGEFVEHVVSEIHAEDVRRRARTVPLTIVPTAAPKVDPEPVDPDEIPF